MSSKLEALKKLGEKRKSADLTLLKTEAYHLSAIEGCAFLDSEYVSPYTKTAGNVDAKVMIVLQDWASVDALLEPGWLATEEAQTCAKLGYTPTMLTNKRLENLLSETFGLTFANIFITNLFPFIKAGGISAPLRYVDLVYCAREFCLPQIDIVQPRIVICTGAFVASAVAEALGGPPIRRGECFEKNGVAYFHQYHPAARAALERQKVLWSSMKGRA